MIVIGAYLPILRCSHLVDLRGSYSTDWLYALKILKYGATLAHVMDRVWYSETYRPMQSALAIY